MAARLPLVIGADGLTQQLQSIDSLAVTTGSNSNGSWRRRPDGILEQWGKATFSGTVLAVTFPIAFSTACNYVDCNPIQPAAGLLTTSAVSAVLTSDPSITGFSLTGRTLTTVAGIVSIGTGNTFSVLWFAAGT